MSRLAFLLPNEDDVLGRFLALTLVVYLVTTGFEDVAVLFSAMVIALAIWTVAVTIQGFKYGYLEGKV
ncbi:hypothetical protein E6P09_05255 [Haloferax mediterranei ATCC 33500]|uniref:Uncharacterized protein n=1 Tax=Haloferax mediterranei (strain ATCC 33500 / DSM 1411 / JCM 8866 / NBRC 14739 / NCIMB 2177 / R-4) TaxID=523841 RepID=I3R1R2_HALMT|nr:hypothetical protein [Haloferax mediterranei]AFK18172.1 hypothetical protein HFX_0437 [Haloferax mediterranei ATCC 33500]AHZ22420.1 hypothetical protein BM92_07070 [Haloferax mediterranei ATCC 33500]EMA02554.1 hypothetical protein C439_08225 [Haloferax mediterranei ATCC 33500]MDX5988263.1 hypothetical protein [Haloferax mediterranei ATCC 33500]QCQ74703.1 hypothetical protein E6P09_05255 [Haloferax mediterranei ATCC 33500]